MPVTHALKPSLFASPVAWTRRKLRLKLGDLVTLMGFKPVESVDFKSMTGQDFAHIIDVGVADGSHDLYARFPNAFIDLFEPHPTYQDQLVTTIVRQRPARLHRMALGGEAASATLYLKGRTGSSIVQDAGRGSLTVDVRRLDAVLVPAEIRRPALLKIDTEGYEMAVLRGASGLLSAIDCVVVEIHFSKPDQYQPNDIIDFLGRHGFQMREMLDFHVKDHCVVCADFVFRRSG